MARVFSINIAKNQIVLDASRKGVAAYSVSNASDQAQKGQAVVRPKQPGIEAWFSVKEPVRDFPVGRSTEVIVEVTVPPQAAKGTYEFELDLIREGGEPLEERTDQGQVVSFEVKEAPKKPFPWVLVAAGAAVLLIIAIAVILLSNRTVDVPNLVEMDATQAARALSDAGLVQGTVARAPSDLIGLDLVIGSTPGAKTPLPRAGSVNLVFSDGKPMSAVPPLKGMTLADATAALAGQGLSVASTSQVFDPTIPSGQVISTNPPAGQVVPPGTPVALLVSKGPQPPTVAPKTLTPAPVIKSLDRAPSEDTFAYPSRYLCLTIKPWIIPQPIIPIVPISPVSYQKPAPQVTLVVPGSIYRTTLVPHFFITLEPLPMKCADSKSPELVVENDLAGGTFYPGVAVMRFDFGTDVPDGAALIKASLKFTAASFGPGTSSMSLYVSAATNAWSVNGAGPVCSGEHSTPITVSGPGTYTADLAPLLANNGPSILKNGLCIQSNTVGLVNLVSSEGGVATQRPLISITWQK